MEEYIASMRQKLDSVMEKLGWDLDTLRQAPLLSVCSSDPNHHIKPESLAKHERLCALTKQGLTRKEAEEIPDVASSCYENADNILCLNISDEEKREILVGLGLRQETDGPNDDLFTPAERLFLFEYIVDRAKRETNQKGAREDDLLFMTDETDDNKGSEDGKSGMITMAELRDFRRRRQTYRAKNVHVTKKSYTEVMREVIGNQMEILEKRIEDDTKAAAEIEAKIEAWKRKVERTSEAKPSKSTDEHSKSKDHSEERSRKRSRSKSPKPSKSKDELSRSKDPSEERSRKRSRSKDRSKDRKRAKEKKSKEKRRSRSRDHGESRSHKSRKRSRSKDKSSDRSRSRHKSKKHRRTSRDEPNDQSRDRDKTIESRDDEQTIESRDDEQTIESRDDEQTIESRDDEQTIESRDDEQTIESRDDEQTIESDDEQTIFEEYETEEEAEFSDEEENE